MKIDIIYYIINVFIILLIFKVIYLYKNLYNMPSLKYVAYTLLREVQNATPVKIILILS